MHYDYEVVFHVGPLLPNVDRDEQKLERKTVARSAATNAGGDDSEKKRPVRRVKKPGRNDPCPCGKLRPNGLPMKYKDCCGKNA